MGQTLSYENRVQKELAVFTEVAAPLGNRLPDIFHYVSNKFWKPKFGALGFQHPVHFFVEYMRKAVQLYPGTTCQFLSVGAGNCDVEVNLAGQLVQGGVTNFRLTCMDLNPHMLERGQALAGAKGLGGWFEFLQTDVNRWQVQRPYHLILANQCLHHFVELEVLFGKIFQALEGNGFFITSDMIGRNGHLRWPEALDLLQAFWSLLPETHKYNHALKRHEPVYENWDCTRDGSFEGVRAQDILPLLVRTFHFETFVGFGNLVDVFVDRCFGPNFKPDEPWDRFFIDSVARLDDYFIESGHIKPTHIIAAMTRQPAGPTKVWKHLTPEFCVRDPNCAPVPSPGRRIDLLPNPTTGREAGAA